jgi:group I intron endonuclease
MKANLSKLEATTFKKLSGVYKITNIKTGEFYIGSTQNLSRRFNQYRNYHNKNINNYNWLWVNDKLEYFEFEVLELIGPNSNLLKTKEQYYFNKLKPNYNKSKNTDLSDIRQLISKKKTSDSKQKIYNIIENWDFQLYGKITSTKIYNNFPISSKTVEKYYKEFKEYIAELNNQFKP